MSEIQEIKSKRQLIVELLSRLHPELDFTNEDVLFGQIYDDYDDYAHHIEAREADIAKAHAEGEVKGRNARIEELMAEPQGDGVPDLRGANTLYSPSRSSIFDLARNTL